MARRTWIARLFTAAVAAVAVSQTASAGIIPASVTVTPDGGNFRWTYAAVLPTNLLLQSGNYFTIYDVGGLVPGTISTPSGWTATTGIAVAAPTGLDPHDSGTAPDITFKYTGPTITGQVGLGNFMFDSTISKASTLTWTASNVNASTLAPDQNITQTTGPAAPINHSGGGGPPAVPEPTTLALAGLGLPLIALARRRLRS
jgi:hypothetical protein